MAPALDAMSLTTLEPALATESIARVHNQPRSRAYSREGGRTGRGLLRHSRVAASSEMIALDIEARSRQHSSRSSERMVEDEEISRDTVGVQ
jgi:hypothetical protein